VKKPIAPLEELKPYGAEQHPYDNPPYELFKPILFDIFQSTDREILKRYVDRAYTEWYNQKNK